MARPKGTGGRSSYDKYRKFQRNWSGRGRGTGGRFAKKNGATRTTYSRFDKPRSSNGRFTKKR